MLYYLENDYLKIAVADQACEIHSIFDKKTNSERIWQPKKGYWQQRGPILFPQISSTSSKKVRIKGQEYEMGNHGILRYAKFDFIAKSENQLVFSICDDKESIKHYPFHFKLVVTYTLIANKLKANYQVINLNEETMPFAFGLHPAFKTDVFESDSYEDYKIDFSEDESESKANLGLDLKSNLKLSRKLFQDYPTVIVENPKSEYATLTNGSHGLKMRIKGCYLFAVWTPDDADFVCLEPWQSGLASQEVDDLEKRANIINLAENEIYETSYSLEVF